ncbi:GrpB family protein [Bacillus lacus]|uniref:GrpB family protein n=1 Tax=Metabacillus lacus TaxID=1983721 RepID=A0A7X2IXF9_9BACI|nr:GrpB family protein [Metabacillus lacus]MRX71613.1 GrpB family protein [Metabacillus lacus]
MKVKLQESSKEWPAHFQLLKQEIESLTEPLLPAIEHIGSTSVPGLKAKPIIDIMAGTAEEQHLNLIPKLLMPHGFSYMELYNNELPFRRFFILPRKKFRSLYPEIMTESNAFAIPHKHRLCHLHVVRYNSGWWKNHLLFRNYLRMHPEDRAAYEQLKVELSARDWRHGNEYAAAKSSFIEGVLVKAGRGKEYG